MTDKPCKLENQTVEQEVKMCRDGRKSDCVYLMDGGVCGCPCAVSTTKNEKEVSC